MGKIKQVVDSVPVIGPAKRRLSFQWKAIRRWYRQWKPPKDSPAYWIVQLLDNRPLQIVQIGSNDGKTNDPFHKLILKNPNWKMLFVEPVPHLFERLKAGYPGEPRFTFENTAINDGTVQAFYFVKEEAKLRFPDIPPWFNQMGSFYRSHILKHFEGKLEPYIAEIPVNGMTLDALFEMHALSQIDVLHIDAEGYDWRILSQLDLGRHQPWLILFEHAHLLPEEKRAACAFLRDRYNLYEFEGDYLCLNKAVSHYRPELKPLFERMSLECQ